MVEQGRGLAPVSLAAIHAELVALDDHILHLRMNWKRPVVPPLPDDPLSFAPRHVESNPVHEFLQSTYRLILETIERVQALIPRDVHLADTGELERDYLRQLRDFLSELVLGHFPLGFETPPVPFGDLDVKRLRFLKEWFCPREES